MVIFLKSVAYLAPTAACIVCPPPPCFPCNSIKHSFAFFFFFLFCVAGPIFSSDFSPEGGFAGIGTEINGYSRKGYSVGGGLALGVDINDSFSTGLKISYFDNFDTVSTLETMLFLRYYLPWLHLPKAIDGPFAQLEAGSAFLFERGYHENLEAFPAFTGGLSAGWRFNLGDNWYVEAAVRAGYPHIWGGGLTAGIRYKNRKTAVTEQEEIIIEEQKEVTPIQIVEAPDDGDFNVSPVIFRSNHADFEGLSPETIKNNRDAIERIAEFLNKHENYKVTIVGHANPTTPQGRARERERSTLVRLSERRAVRVLEELGKLGVSYKRMTVSGMGFSKMKVPYNDRKNNWKNRRVDFILYMEKGGLE